MLFVLSEGEYRILNNGTRPYEATPAYTIPTQLTTYNLSLLISRWRFYMPAHRAEYETLALQGAEISWYESEIPGQQ